MPKSQNPREDKRAASSTRSVGFAREKWTHRRHCGGSPPRAGDDLEAVGVSTAKVTGASIAEGAELTPRRTSKPADTL